MREILIAESDEAVRILLELELSWAGYSVSTTHDYGRLQHQIQQDRPAVVLVGFSLLETTDIPAALNHLASLGLPVIIYSNRPVPNVDMDPVPVDLYVQEGSDLTELIRRTKSAIDRGSGAVPKKGPARAGGHGKPRRDMNLNHG